MDAFVLCEGSKKIFLHPQYITLKFFECIAEFLSGLCENIALRYKENSTVDCKARNVFAKNHNARNE